MKSRLPDIFTGLNLLCGLFAVNFSIQYNFLAASLLLLLAILFDGLDGVFARKYGSNHNKGHYLDSIADSISFCLAPGLLVFFAFYNFSNSNLINTLLVFITTLLIITLGILRLLRFSLRGYQLTNFEGVPTPAMALTVMITLVLFGGNGYALYKEEPLIVIPLLIITSSLMVSKIEYPKIRFNNFTSFGLLLAFFTSLAIGLRYWADDRSSMFYSIAFLSGTIAFVTILLYLGFGPVYCKKVVGSKNL